MQGTVKELATLYKQLHDMGEVNEWNYHSNFFGAPFIEIIFGDRRYIQVSLTPDTNEKSKKINVAEAVELLTAYIAELIK